MKILELPLDNKKMERLTKSQSPHLRKKATTSVVLFRPPGVTGELVVNVVLAGLEIPSGSNLHNLDRFDATVVPAGFAGFVVPHGEVLEKVVEVLGGLDNVGHLGLAVNLDDCVLHFTYSIAQGKRLSTLFYNNVSRVSVMVHKGSLDLFRVHIGLEIDSINVPEPVPSGLVDVPCFHVITRQRKRSVVRTRDTSKTRAFAIWISGSFSGIATV